MSWKDDEIGQGKDTESNSLPKVCGDKTHESGDLLAAYREKRKWDGGEGRVWNASKHLDAEDLIKKLEG